MATEMELALKIKASVDQAAAALRTVSDQLKGIGAAGASADSGTTSASAGLDSVTASANAAAAAVDRANASMAVSGGAGAAAASTGAEASSSAAPSAPSAVGYAGAGAALEEANKGVEESAQKAAGAIDSIALSSRGAAAMEAEASGEAAALRASWDRIVESSTAATAAAAGDTVALQALRDEQNGVRDSLSGFIVEQRAAATAEEEGAAAAGTEAAAMEGLKLSSGGATREYSALVDEMLSGRTRRIPGTLATLSNRIGLMKYLFTGTGLAAVGAAAGIGVFATAALKAEEEEAAFNRAVEESGGYLGVTRDEYHAMAKEIAGDSVTIGQARAALQAVAETGRFTGDELRQVGIGAASMAQLTGESIKKAVGEFAKIGDNPEQAARKLNSQLHFLTASTYEQIAALQREGDTEQATRVLVEQLSQAMAQRADKAHSQEHGILALLHAEAHGWSIIGEKIKSAFSSTTPQEELDKIDKKIHATFEELQRVKKAGGAIAIGRDTYETASQLEAALHKLGARQAALSKQIVGSHDRAKSKAAVDAETQAVIEQSHWLDNEKASLDKKVRMEQELAHLARVRADAEKLANDSHASAADRAGARKVVEGTDWSKLQQDIRNKYSQHSQDIVAVDEQTLSELEAREKVSYNKRSGFELDFWKKKLAGMREGTAEYAQVYHRVAALQQQVQQKEEQQARQHEQKMAEIRQLDIESVRSAGLSQIQISEMMVRHRLSMGLIGGRQEVAQLKSLEDAKLRVQLKALDDQLAAAKGDEVERRRILRQIQQAEQQHATTIEQLNERMQLSVRKKWIQSFGVVTNAIDQSVKGMIRGTLTWRNAERNFLQSMTGEFIDMAMKRVSHWVATQIALTTVTAAGESSRAAIEDAANKQSLLKTAATVTKKILMKMWDVMASVYSAIASIPYVGPFLAPVMAIAAGALVASWAGRVASAAGGWWEIPNDQMAMVHKQEMVLPAREAEGIRNLVRGGGNGGSNTYHIHAMDAESFRDYARQNRDILAEALGMAHRDGAFA